MIVGKILMQDIWSAKIEWDEVVPLQIANRWEEFWNQLSHLESIRIPRWIGMGSGVKLELHGFADSSIKAYGCNIVLRAIEPANHLQFARVQISSGVVKTSDHPTIGTSGS